MFNITNPWKKPADPTVQELIEKQLYDAETALLEAETEFERAKHNKAMFLDRVERLRALRRDADLPTPGIPCQLVKVAA
jgi:hypothetical protein